MNRGLVMHKAAEQFIKGEINELPKELNRLNPVLSELQQAHTAGCVHVEENWGFDMGWKPVDFSAENVWTRGSLDALWVDSPISARGFDWKSGKRYPVKHIQQEQLYAVYSFEMFPSLEDFTFHFGYADEKSEYPNNMTARHYTRTAALKLKQGFHARGLRMTTDDEHKPRPSPVNCKWCDYKDSCEWAK